MCRCDIKVILMPFSYLRAADSNEYESIMSLWKSRVCIHYKVNNWTRNGLSITV